MDWSADKYYSKPFIRIPAHIIFWVLSWIFLYRFYGEHQGQILDNILFNTLILFITILTAYFTIYFLFPRYLFKKKYGLFILYSIYTFVVSLYLELLVVMIFFIWVYNYMSSNISPASRDVYFLITGTYFIVILASVIKLVRIRAEDQRKNQLLLQEKIETELKLLKSQIHPHFLFNTLNNLYALALKKSEHMPEMILKLSEMLDYLLYQSNDPSVPVRKELELIENYISLEKMRYGDRLEINLLSTGNLDKIEIPPLMIIPLIENAFKHGISKMRDKVWINILIKREKNLLNIQIENSKFNNGQISANQNFKGIGLKNLQRRLDLLFEDKYELDIIDQKDRFIVNLQLIISIDQHET